MSYKRKKPIMLTLFFDKLPMFKFIAPDEFRDAWFALTDAAKRAADNIDADNSGDMLATMPDSFDQFSETTKTALTMIYGDILRSMAGYMAGNQHISNGRNDQISAKAAAGAGDASSSTPTPESENEPSRADVAAYIQHSGFTDVSVNRFFGYMRSCQWVHEGQQIGKDNFGRVILYLHQHPEKDKRMPGLKYDQRDYTDDDYNSVYTPFDDASGSDLKS